MTQNIFYNVDLKISSHNSVLCVVKISNLLLNKKKNFLKEGNFIIIWKNYKFNFFLRMLSLSRLCIHRGENHFKRGTKKSLNSRVFLCLKEVSHASEFLAKQCLPIFQWKIFAAWKRQKSFCSFTPLLLPRCRLRFFFLTQFSH